MSRLFEWLIVHLPWPSISAVLRQLANKRKWVLITTTGFLLSALGLGYLYWVRSTRYEGVIRDTLARECMPTPQIYKGLEAFIVSSIPDNVEAYFLAKDFNPLFREALRQIPSRLKSANLAATPALTVAPGNNGGLVLNDNLGGYLFLPIQILRPTFTEEDRNVLESADPGLADRRRLLLTETLKADPQLARDIAFTAALAPTLNSLTQTTVTPETNDQPKQAYIITKNGVNRIMNANVAGKSAYQFPDTTFFPSRPYFWPVFDPRDTHPKFADKLENIEPPSGSKLGDYFTVSKPYMDLGGNGLVVTLARGIMVDGYPRAVLCIDLPVRTETKLHDAVRERVRSLDGYSMEVECDLSNKKCWPVGTANFGHTERDPLVAHMQDTLQNRVIRQNRAEILGNIIVLGSTSKADGLIEASLPLSITGEEREQFLLISMDLVSYRRLTTVIGCGAATLVGLSTLLLAYFGGLHAKRSQDYQAAFARVAQVMAESPTPYARLNSADKITDFSGSFLNLIGLRPEDTQQASCMEFRGLLADDDSRKTYDDVEGRRRRREKVDPYHVTIMRKDGHTVRVKIVSAAVPAPTGGEMPETFGLLLRQADEDLVSLDFVDAARRSLRDAAS